MPSATWYAGWTLLATCIVPLVVLAFLLPPFAALARCLHAACSPVDDERVRNSGRVAGPVDDFIDPDAKPTGRAYRM